jgi:hypothetical protein
MRRFSLPFFKIPEKRRAGRADISYHSFIPGASLEYGSRYLFIQPFRFDGHFVYWVSIFTLP